MVGVTLGRFDARRAEWEGKAMKLKGRVALVTGGSRGIGRAIAMALAEAGADVAINYVRNQALAQEVAEAIEKMGGVGEIFQADINDPEHVLRMHDAILRRFERVDILVNNAGINRDKSFIKMDYETWKAVVSVDLDGAFYCTKAFVGEMKARGYGRIINISSVIGQMGNFGQANYAAAKAALLGLTKTLAREFALKGVTVNAVAPGFIETEMVTETSHDVQEKILAQVPLRRFGRPEEVAHAVVFLASDDAGFITGQTINVNGGVYM